MKKILIIEVPYDPDIDGEYIKILSLEITVLFDNMPVRYSGALKFTEFTPPTDLDVQDKTLCEFNSYPNNDKKEGLIMGFIFGVNWLKSLLQ